MQQRRPLGWVEHSLVYRKPARMTTAETRNEPASIRIAPRGETTISSAPPMALPTICALCAAMRNSDRAGTYAASGTIHGERASSAAGDARHRPDGDEQRQEHGHGNAGQRHHGDEGRAARSQATSSRRRGMRSTTAESSAPETR